VGDAAVVDIDGAFRFHAGGVWVASGGGGSPTRGAGAGGGPDRGELPRLSGVEADVSEFCRGAGVALLAAAL
jgi:hypothetical protein